MKSIIMAPFLYLLSLVSFALGIAAITLFILVYLEHKTRILKYYLGFIICISAFSLIDMLHAYLQNYYKIVPVSLSIIFWELIFLFSGAFLYCYSRLLRLLLKLERELAMDKAAKALVAVFVVAGSSPFFIHDTPEKILHALELFSNVVIDPLEFAFGVFILVVQIKNYGRIDVPIIKATIRANIVLLVVSIVALLSLNFIARFVTMDVSLSSYFYFNIVYLFWNAASIVYFFSLARQTAADTAAGEYISFNKAEQVLSDTLQKYEKSGISDDEVAQGFRMLLAYVNDKKPYLDPEMTLEALSQGAGMPKHHLSRIINQARKCNFYDFLNEYRIDEFKSIIRKKKDITILEAAFESGFNSKAAFYKAFKKATGITPLAFSKKTTE